MFRTAIVMTLALSGGVANSQEAALVGERLDPPITFKEIYSSPGYETLRIVGQMVPQRHLKGVCFRGIGANGGAAIVVRLSSVTVCSTGEVEEFVPKQQVFPIFMEVLLDGKRVVVCVPGIPDVGFLPYILDEELCLAGVTGS